MKLFEPLLLCVFLLLLSANTEAQQEGIGELEEFVSHLVGNSSNDYAVEVAQEILKGNQKNLSFAEYCSIGLAATFCYDDARGPEWGRLAVMGMESTVLEQMQTIRSAGDEQKKAGIRSLLNYYPTLVPLYVLYKPTECQLDFNQIVVFFHQFVYKQKDKLFDKTNDDDILSLLNIIASERFYCYLLGKYDILFEEYMPEFASLAEKLPAYYSLLVYYQFKAFDYCVFHNKVVYNKDFRLLRIADSESADYMDIISCQNDPFVGDRTNYYLRLKELELKASGGDLRLSGNKLYISNGSPIGLGKVDWKSVKQSLNRNECALLVYGNYLITKTGQIVVEGTLITADTYKPIELFAENPESMLNLVFDKYPQFNRVFLTLCGEYENADVAYCDDRVCLKYSLLDINAQKAKNFNKGEIYVIADIDYGEENVMTETDVKKMHNDKILVSRMKEMFGDKMYSLTGKKVNKINFMNTIGRFSIFHVSTHGIIVTNDPSPQNKNELLSAISGSTNMSQFVLALSNYHQNNDNSISADEIRKMDFSTVDLVFLDACKTGNSKATMAGSHSVSKSFYLGGASNVVSYLGKVNQDIALEFALRFYQELTTGDVTNYHDAFYKTKRTIINKYKDVLFEEEQGRPVFSVVLYE